MFQLIEYGELFLEMINSVGDFLLFTPEEIPVYDFLTGGYVLAPNPFGNIASLIFGSGITFILGYRFVKFFTDAFL